MFTRMMRSVLAAALLAPWLILAYWPSASAVDHSYSEFVFSGEESVGVRVGSLPGVPFDETVCWFEFQWDVTASTYALNFENMRCEGLNSLGDAPSEVTFTASGVDGSGAECHATTSSELETLEHHWYNGWDQSTWIQESMVWTIPCYVDQFDMHLEHVEWGPIPNNYGDFTWRPTMPDMPDLVPIPVSSGCAYGTPTKARWEAAAEGGSGSDPIVALLTANFSQDRLPSPVPSDAGNQWGMALVYDTSSGSASQVSQSPLPRIPGEWDKKTLTNMEVGFPQPSSSALHSPKYTKNTGGFYTTGPFKDDDPGNPPHIKGIQIWSHDKRSGTSSSVNLARNLSVRWDGTTTTNVAGTGVLGRTIESECYFYFGVKIVTGTNPQAFPWSIVGEPPPDETDPPEPDGSHNGGAGHGADPDEAEAGCSWSWTDPLTWTGGGWCIIAQALKMIFNRLGDLIAAIGNLADAIADAIADALGPLLGLADAILDGLAGLFVPDLGDAQSQMNGIKNDWRNSSVGEYQTAASQIGGDLQDLSVSGGCAGPNVSIPFPGMDAVEFEPFNACSGGMATASGVVKAFLTVTVILGAVLAALRIVAASIGLNLSFGKGSGE